MANFEVIGTGHFVPGKPVTNADLSRIMSTSDEWIFQRSGIRQRHYVSEGMGVSDLAKEASLKAIEAAGIKPEEIDHIVMATMTPEYMFPGSGPLVGAKLGIPGVPALDIRQQCAAVLYGLQVVDGLIATGAAKTVLLVGADAHAGFMPWDSWDWLEKGTEPTPEMKAKADRHRGLAVLFGDGAGAMILRKTDRDAGLRGMKVHSDGNFAELLYVAGGGFRTRPYLTKAMVENESYIPHMDGKELFKFAVTKLPSAAREVLQSAGKDIAEVDWFLAHQANLRINEFVRKELKVATEKMPMNIDRFGNTSAGTIPILVDEQVRGGHLKRGDLTMLLALGTGVHWGCGLWKF